MKLPVIFSVMVTGLLMGVSPLHARDGPVTTLTPWVKHIYPSDVDATSSEVAMTETAFNFSHEFKMSSGMPVGYALEVGHMDIHYDGPVDLPSHLESRGLSAGIKFPAPLIEDDRYFMGLDVKPTFNTDGYTWESGAFRVPLRAYLIYKESDDLIFFGGISVRPDYDVQVLPILGFIYKANDRLSFNIASKPHIAYKLTEETTFLWKFNFTLEEYEVTRGSQEGVVLKYKDFSTGVGIEHKFNETIRAALSVGGVFGRRLEYRDDVGKVAPDAGLYTDFSLTAAF
jgi:hypothetical protein